MRETQNEVKAVLLTLLQDPAFRDYLLESGMADAVQDVINDKIATKEASRLPLLIPTELAPLPSPTTVSPRFLPPCFCVRPDPCARPAKPNLTRPGTAGKPGYVPHRLSRRKSLSPSLSLPPSLPPLFLSLFLLLS